MARQRRGRCVTIEGVAWSGSAGSNQGCYDAAAGVRALSSQGHHSHPPPPPPSKHRYHHLLRSEQQTTKRANKRWKNTANK